MRTIPLWVLPVTAILISAICVRRHASELASVARTYATFYSYLNRHPDALYRHSELGFHDASTSESSPEPFNPPLVPAQLHQIHLQEGRPSILDRYSAAINSCRTLHDGWSHTIWTDDSADTFMKQHYPTIYPHYIGYRQSIQRANILRYAVLDTFGGVYLDLDVTCRQSLEHLRHVPWLTPGAHPAGVNNAFILARPNHPFLKHLLDAVPSRDLRWYLPYIENMLSTGCMFFSNMWMSYVRQQDRQPADGTEAKTAVYILADERGDLGPHMLRGVITTPLFHHGGASSWHGWDAAAIVLVGEYYMYLLPGGLALGALLSWVMWRVCGRNIRRRRRSWALMVKRTMSSAGCGVDPFDHAGDIEKSRLKDQI